MTVLQSGNRNLTHQMIVLLKPSTLKSYELNGKALIRSRERQTEVYGVVVWP